jgi:phosphoenolpyruvate-protein phosphotransferase (PTS system enzyme I)
MTERKRVKRSGGPKRVAQLEFSGNAVSRGVAAGPLVRLYGNNRQFLKVELKLAEARAEVERFRLARSAASEQLRRLVRNRAGRRSAGSDILDAQIILIEDPALASAIEAHIQKHRVNAEWAVKQFTDEYIAKLRQLGGEGFADRLGDLEDVTDRMLSSLDGKGPTDLAITRGAVIAATELQPSTLIQLSRYRPAAIVTEEGGWTSHTFIMAREMKIPAVTGIRLAALPENVERVVVDGYTGRLVVDPTPDPHEVSANHSAPAATGPLPVASKGPFRTLDGHTVRIFANADSPAAYRRAAAYGADGVGLFRSEALVGMRRSLPGEAAQAKAYAAMAEVAGDVKVRCFDLPPERIHQLLPVREKNPALGTRGLRFASVSKDILRTQVRAVLRASHRRKIDLVVPMVSDIAELLSVRALLREESRSLRKAGIRIGSPKLGAMIEVPSLVLLIDEVMQECDFACLGTNDLIQYLLAADRDNVAASRWYRTLHPAVLRALGAVMDAGRKAGKPIIVCGEMAGSPYYVPLLIGMGAAELSMNPQAMPGVRSVIPNIAADEARRLVRSIRSLKTADEVEEAVAEHALTHWSHLFPPEIISAV